MSEDPISKSRIGPGMGRPDIIPRNQGCGNIPTDKDYSQPLKGRQSRAVFVSFCAVPYLVTALYLFLTSDEIVAILLLLIPLVIGLLFWILFKLVNE